MKNLWQAYYDDTSGTRAYGRDRTSLSQLKCKRIHPPNNTHNIMISIMYQRDILDAVMGERESQDQCRSNSITWRLT